MSDTSGIVYRAVPVQLIAEPDGVIIKRGTLATHVGGARAFEVVQTIFDRAAQGALIEDFREPFEDNDHAVIDNIVGILITRRLLMPAEDASEYLQGQETPETIFYWEFNQSAELVR